MLNSRRFEVFSLCLLKSEYWRGKEEPDGSDGEEEDGQISSSSSSSTESSTTPPLITAAMLRPLLGLTRGDDNTSTCGKAVAETIQCLSVDAVGVFGDAVTVPADSEQGSAVEEDTRTKPFSFAINVPAEQQAALLLPSPPPHSTININSQLLSVLDVSNNATVTRLDDVVSVVGVAGHPSPSSSPSSSHSYCHFPRLTSLDAKCSALQGLSMRRRFCSQAHTVVEEGEEEGTTKAMISTTRTTLSLPSAPYSYSSFLSQCPQLESINASYCEDLCHVDLRGARAREGEGGGGGGGGGGGTVNILLPSSVPPPLLPSILLHLTTLDLSRCPYLQSFPKGLATACPQLRVLDLSHSGTEGGGYGYEEYGNHSSDDEDEEEEQGLTCIPPDALPVNAIEALYLAHCTLLEAVIDGVRHCHRLRILDLTGCSRLRIGGGGGEGGCGPSSLSSSWRRGAASREVVPLAGLAASSDLLPPPLSLSLSPPPNRNPKYPPRVKCGGGAPQQSFHSSLEVLNVKGCIVEGLEWLLEGGGAETEGEADGGVVCPNLHTIRIGTLQLPQRDDGDDDGGGGEGDEAYYAGLIRRYGDSGGGGDAHGDSQPPPPSLRCLHKRLPSLRIVEDYSTVSRHAVM